MKSCFKSPQTYAQWSDCLDILNEGLNDDDIAFAMAAGSAQFESGVIENFARRFSAVFDKRLNTVAAELDRALKNVNDEVLLSRALLDARRKLNYLYHVATLTSLPSTVAAHLGEMVDKYATQTDSSLQSSAKKDRSGRLSQLLQRHALSEYRGVTRVIPVVHQPERAAEDSPLSKRKRLIML